MPDRNLELYKSKVREYYEKLIEGNKILKLVVGEKWKGDMVTKSSSDIKRSVGGYLRSLSDAQYKKQVKQLKLSRYYGEKSKVVENPLSFVKSVLGIVYGVEMVTSRIGSNKSGGQYTNMKTFSMKWLLEIQSKVNPYSIEFKDQMEMVDIEEDEYDELDPPPRQQVV